MNTPGVVLEMPSLLPKDLEYIEGAKSENIEYIALSFVRDRRDIEQLRSELVARNMNSQIVAKIENQAAIDNLAEIIASADAIMVARGDLGVEVPYYEVPHWQKFIIQECRKANKMVITATQMLLSMTQSPRPTRAEVSDVANAVYDGTSAVMLSEESASGLFPVKSVETQAQIVAYHEKFV
jgi:pyruvate kinase